MGNTSSKTECVINRPQVIDTAEVIDIPTCNIILLGNPGSGKSTLCNSLIRSFYVNHDEVIFSSGCSNDGKALTHEFKTHANVTDTPGLSECLIEDRAKNAAEIMNALRRDGSYVLLFVNTLCGGRLYANDLVTMRLILGSLNDIQNVTYGVIFNKISKKMCEQLQIKENFDVLKDYVNETMPVKTNHFFVYERDLKADDRDNYLLPQNKVFYDFINSIPPTILSSQTIKHIDINEYEQLKRQLKHQIDELIKENDELSEKIKSLKEDDELLTKKIEMLVNYQHLNLPVFH